MIEKIFDRVTYLIPQFENAEAYGRWEDLGLHAGTKEDPHSLPHVSYDDDDIDIYDLIIGVGDAVGTMALTPYDPVFDEAKGILESMQQVFHAERICDGAILECCESGQMLKWMKRLEDLDEERIDRLEWEAVFGRNPKHAANMSTQTSAVVSEAESSPAESRAVRNWRPGRLSDEAEQAIKDDPDAEYYRFDFGESYVKFKRAEGLCYLLTIHGEWVEYPKIWGWFAADDHIHERI